jgi:lysophospholipase L1-like esterase
MGDSLSDGFGLSNYDEKISGISPNAYPCLLLGKINAEIPDSEMLFIGGAGAELKDMLFYSQNIPETPDLVMLWAGTNEVLAWARYGRDKPTDPETFKAQYSAIIANLKLNLQNEGKEVPIVVGTIHNLSWIPDYGSWDSGRKQTVQEMVCQYNLAIRSIAALHGISVVGFDNVDSPFKNGAYLSDGVHPSAELQQAIADTFWKALDPMIKNAQKE